MLLNLAGAYWSLLEPTGAYWGLLLPTVSIWVPVSSLLSACFCPHLPATACICLLFACYLLATAWTGIVYLSRSLHLSPKTDR
jgi:hypothetical protein